MARHKRFPPPKTLRRMGANSRTLAKHLSSRRPHGETEDTVERSLSWFLQVLSAQKALMDDLEGILPGDFLEEAPAAIREAAPAAIREATRVLRLDKPPAWADAKSDAKPVAGWGCEVRDAVALLWDLSKTIHEALEDQKSVSLTDVQGLERAADVLLEAAGGAPPQEPQGQTVPESPSIRASAMELLLGDEGKKILEIANNQEWDLEKKIQEIVRVDRRMLGWKSPEWADLLNVTEGRIRQTEAWKAHHKQQDANATD